VQQHDAHLQQDFQLLRDLIRFAVGERFGAITALEQKCLSALRGCQPLAQGLHFPRHDNGG
jgi:hypothetical protein